jgi:hypothetical protein
VDKHRPEETDVVVAAAQFGADVRVRLLGLLRGALRFGSRADFCVQRDAAIAHEDAIAARMRVHSIVLVAVVQVNIVADFALEAHIGHDALHRFGVDARQIARIGVAVRVAVAHIEQDHEVVSDFGIAVWCVCINCSHHSVPPLFQSSPAVGADAVLPRGVKNSRRW